MVSAGDVRSYGTWDEVPAFDEAVEVEGVVVTRVSPL